MTNQTKKRIVIIGEQINTIGELRQIIKDFDDQDIIRNETIDENGDVADLHPMYIDVISGVKLLDDTIVREVRFCQIPNAELDTRDKQPLVDDCIEQIKCDIEEQDLTAIDELLKKLPWEILKNYLPED